MPNSDCNIHYLDRSFPSHKMFIEGTSEGKEGRATLFRVLAVYAMYNPQVSYCQGKPQPVVHLLANAIYYWYLSYCQGKPWPIFPFVQMPLANRCLFYLLILVSNEHFFFLLIIFTGMSYIAGMFLMNMDEEVGLFDV